jgi:putative pyruvate formate lyase activating enzyme
METVDFSSMLRHCELCPRKCGANRLSGKPGFCGAGSEVEIFRYAPHHGEEPPVSGSRGSGTIFFSRCTLRCLYCQNYPWSQEGAGGKIPVESLAHAMRALADQGCHNWNLVSPTHWLPMICRALDIVKRDVKKLPIVYNTSSYERPETLRALEGLVDIYLADLRYAREETAQEGSGVADYVECSRAALLEMWRQVGPLETTPEGIGLAGVICRILILPGLADEACENIRWLAGNIGTKVAVSVMAQYTPAYKAGRMEKWNRQISHDEYRQVCREVEKNGFTDGWIQDYNCRPNLEQAGFNMPAMELVAGEA